MRIECGGIKVQLTYSPGVDGHAQGAVEGGSEGHCTLRPPLSSLQHHASVGTMRWSALAWHFFFPSFFHFGPNTHNSDIIMHSYRHFNHTHATEHVSSDVGIMGIAIDCKSN